MSSLQVLSVRVPRESDNTPEQTAQLLASLARATRAPGLIGRLSGETAIHLALEITLVDGQVTFAVVHPDFLSTFVQSQVLATYPDVVMDPRDDYLAAWRAAPPYMTLVRQQYAAYFPLRDYADYKE